MVVLGSMIRRTGDHPQSRPVIERAPAGQAQASLLAVFGLRILASCLPLLIAVSRPRGVERFSSSWLQYFKFTKEITALPQVIE